MSMTKMFIHCFNLGDKLNDYCAAKPKIAMGKIEKFLNNPNFDTKFSEMLSKFETLDVHTFYETTDYTILYVERDRMLVPTFK